MTDNPTQYPIHGTASALALFTFRTTFGQGGLTLQSHSIHTNNGHTVSLNENATYLPPSHRISEVALDTILLPTQYATAKGEMRLKLYAPEAHIHRLRRSTAPLFVQLSNTTELVPGRTNVIFLKAFPKGETLNFSAASTNPAWKLDISPVIASGTEETEIMLSIVVPMHSKSGVSGSVTVSGSNEKIVIGAKRIDLSVGEGRVRLIFSRLND